jgi:hypothetical protein
MLLTSASGASLAELLSTGRVFDFLLAFIALELATFCGYRLLRQEHLVPVDVYFHMAAALGLLGAARAVLLGAWWGQTGLMLAAALLAHGFALSLRWRARAAAQGVQRMAWRLQYHSRAEWKSHALRR